MKVRLIISISILCVTLSEGIAQDRAKVHSFDFRGAELRSALDSLMRWYDVPLVYLDKDIADKRVSAVCAQCTFEEALGKVIKGQELVWKTLGRQVLLHRQAIEPEVSAATFAGTLKDTLTGQAIIGANVVLLTPLEGQAAQESTKIYRWCSTNQFGFFSLRNIHPGNYVLNIRRIGYRTMYEPLTVLPGAAVVCDLSLSEQHVTYPEITIEGRRSVLTASEGISRGVYIRGTPSDDNQYFLEGARIYNPLHFGGVMSTFNGDALRDVELVAGGVPPYYGGRIGGILDVLLRNGSAERVTGSAGVGSLGSNLMLEGPVSDGTTYVISGRRGYPDVFFPLYKTNETPSDLNSSEIMAKVSRELAGNQRLSLSGYFGQDTYEKEVTGMQGDQLLNNLRWRNAAANLRWIGVASPSLFFYTSAVYTRYDFNMEHRFGEILNGNTTYASDYIIQDAAIRSHAEYFYDEYHTVLAGVDLVRHWMAGRISEFSTQIAPMSLDGLSPWELSVYLQDQWQLVPSASAELGARATSFIAKQGSFSAIDPRFALLVSLENDLRLYSSFSAINQFLHPYRHSGIFLFYPSVFLYPSTENVRPSTSLQISIGMEKTFAEDRYRLAVESYYRTTQNLHEFLFDTTATTLSNALILGEGNVYGAEITLDKRTGDFTGSVRYSYSWASNRFAELNGGEPFRPRFDRRHEFYAKTSYLLSENWAAGVSCLLSSNQFPSFAPTGLRGKQDVRVTVGPANGAAYAEPYDLNGGRLPGFQRLELSILRRFSWMGMPFEASLRLLNGYGLIDPFDWELRQNSDTRLMWAVTFDAPPMFPLYPVVSLSTRF